MAYTTIDDPSAHFQTALWTGTGSSQNITNDGNSDLKPDWVWIKERGQANNHKIYDSTRGTTKFLVSATNDSEGTDSNGLTAFLTDGFTLGGGGSHNASSNTYVGWQWKANGGTTTTNDASSTGVGSIDSVYQANTTAGFSIVTYTGTGSTATVAHGLGAVPDMLIFKKRSAADNWYVYHKSLTNDYYIVLDTTGAKSNDVNIWNDTDPTSTVFSIANAGVHADGKTMVCYAFAEKQGYSKFGSYTANNSTDGPFVYLGFKPAWILVRNTSAAADWPITDNKREAGNPFGEEILFANASSAETNYSGGGIDFLSNGFKIRSSGTNGVHNANNTSHKFIYMAFAESPFVSSKGVPTTAR